MRRRELVWISIGEAIFYVDPADGWGETLLTFGPLEYTDSKPLFQDLPLL